MNDDLTLRYSQLKENDPTHPDASSEQQLLKAYEEYYTDAGHVRNVCFVWQDGKRIFLNYSYLITGEYLPNDNTIKLVFTTHSLILKGVNLQSLFYDVMEHLVKQVTSVDTRYNVIGENELFVVNTIMIREHGDAYPAK